MLQVTVPESKPRIREGVSVKTGKPVAWRMVTQSAFLVYPDGSTEAFNLRVRQDKEGRDVLLAPGRYTLAPESFYLKDGELALSPKWMPLAEARGAK
jgi:hypothetical protein